MLFPEILLNARFQAFDAGDQFSQYAKQTLLIEF